MIKAIAATPQTWAALKNVLVYADMALHAHAQGFAPPPLPTPEMAKAWLQDSFTLRTALEIAAKEKMRDAPR